MKISRVTQYLFGSTAGSTQIGQFGSLAAGSALFTSNPATIQQLSQYLQGWYGAVIGGNSPAIQDLNAIDYLYSYQIGYILQEGIPEYDSNTTYYTNSLCTSGSQIYQSLIDTNQGNTPISNPSDWQTYPQKVNLPPVLSHTSASTGTGFTGSTSFVNLPNLSTTEITVGRPVYMMLSSDGQGSPSYLDSATTGSNAAVSYIQFSRSGTSIAIFALGSTSPTTGSNGIALPPSSFAFLDAPSAGSYNYTVQAKSLSGTDLFYSNVVLVTWQL
jgi:hypothetical protein